MAGVDGDADIAAVARLLADGTRATFCVALMDGRFRTGGELARAAGVSASTASEHLSRLVEGGLLEETRQGRHRYVRLAGPEVAAAVESLGLLARARPVRSLREASAGAALRAGRTCYDHLAGRLGVAVTQALVERGVLDDSLALADLSPLQPLRLDLGTGTRAVVRPCLDWTERRHHVAGALPGALAGRLFELDWLERLGTGRAVRLTAEGRDRLSALLWCDLATTAA